MPNDVENAAENEPARMELYLHAKRESWVLLIAFSVFLVWSITTSYALGYDVAPTDISRTVWGMPRWVFWGIAVPWMAANVFTFAFCMFCMADDPLDDTSDGEVT